MCACIKETTSSSNKNKELFKEVMNRYPVISITKTMTNDQRKINNLTVEIPLLRLAWNRKNYLIIHTGLLKHKEGSVPKINTI